MGVGKKYMGNMISCLTKYVQDTINEYHNPDNTRVMVTYSTATQEMIDTTVKLLKDLTSFKEILVTKAGSVINSHCGENTLGILYLNDGNENHY